MADIIPEKVLTYLPFDPEPISDWGDNSDLRNFLLELFDQPCVFIAPDGSRHESNYSDYGDHLYDDGIVEMTALANELSTVSLETHSVDDNAGYKQPIDFIHDPHLGSAAKSIVAWKAIDSAVLSESAFVSIHHILEAGTDLDCSVTLVKKHYYKQAAYCLRAFVENVTLPLYFSQNLADLAKWKSDEFHTPQFCGKKGLLTQLVKQGFLPDRVAKKIGNIYGRLNSSVHSGIESMIHKGHEERNWRGLSFKRDELNHWCDATAQCVEAGITVMKVQTDLWLKGPGSDSEMCTICHTVSDYNVERYSFGGRSIAKVICKKCGHVWHRDAR